MKRLICLVVALLSVLLVTSCGGAPEAQKTDFAFEKGSTVIAVKGDMAPILAALGDWIDYDESPSCGFTGISKLYTYAGFDIETYPTDGKDYVYRVELYDDSVATAEGIKVGDSKARVVETYGNADSESATIMTYKAEKMYLRILFSSDGAVSKIQYLHPNAVENQ